jgi:hypothetical protein
MISHIIAIATIAALTIATGVGTFLIVIHALYMGDRGPYRRRMPKWLIAWILIWFLVMPRIDVVYAQTRLKDNGQQEG